MNGWTYYLNFVRFKLLSKFLMWKNPGSLCCVTIKIIMGVLVILVNKPGVKKDRIICHGSKIMMNILEPWTSFCLKAVWPWTNFSVKLLEKQTFARFRIWTISILVFGLSQKLSFWFPSDLISCLINSIELHQF